MATENKEGTEAKGAVATGNAAEMDDFDGAFDEAVKEAQSTITSKQDEVDPADGNDAEAKAAADKKAADDKAAADKATADAAAAEAAKKTTDDAAAKKAADEQAAKDAAAAAKTPEQIAADAEAAKQAATDAAARAAVDKAARERVEADAAAKKTQEAADAAAAKAKEAEYKPYVPNDDEKKQLDHFKAEWSDISQAVDIRIKEIEGVLTQRILNAAQTVLQLVNQDVAPVLQRQTVDAETRHFATIKAAHSDYDAVIADVPGWIQKQPKYLQTALQAAYDGGDAEAVTDLISRFKESTGRVTPQKSEQTPASPKPATDPAAAAALAPVSSKRSTASPGAGAPDMNDFDGAFDEAASKAK
jgi:hypothetical protein